jgi:hypothetical protein
MLVLQQKWKWLQLLFNGLAIISGIIAGNITSYAVYDVIMNNEVFMTTIHGIFLNPFFLITAAYLGLYLLYSLLIQFLKILTE